MIIIVIEKFEKINNYSELAMGVEIASQSISNMLREV